MSAIFLTLGGAEVGRTLYRVARATTHGAPPIRPMIWILGYMISAGILAGVAWWNMRRGGRFTAGWMLAVSLYHVMVLPFGPLVAIAGLLVFLRRGQRHALRHKQPDGHRPKAGDATSRWSQGAFWVVQWGCVLAGYPLIARFAQDLGLVRPPGSLINYLDLPLAIVASIAMHEMGHAVGAWASEFQVCHFQVGPLTANKLDGRWRVEWIAALGGGVGAVPTSDRLMRSRVLFFTAAGPVASAMTGCVSTLFFLAAPGTFWEPYWSFFALLGLFGLSDAIANLVPVGIGGGVYSDGARLWQLALDGPWSRQILFAYYRGLSATTMLSPADWPSDMVEESARFAASSGGGLKEILLAYCHFRLKGNDERARLYFQTFAHRTSLLPANRASRMAPEIAFFEAVYFGNLTAAREWLERSRDRSISDHWRARAAVLALSGDLTEGREAWCNGWRMVAQAPPTGNRLLDEHDFRRMAERWWPDLVALTPPPHAELEPVAV
ncbi:M50 family metallopeptidase [uncultured Paludibaculum sp.]|uniref:M50 family metallopeptidase n=1 Tax=uncultured Paludibaculum sp. TaxID=1765020 RepID=UPI002AAB23DA|nr:M50 family metallopeptidase [uncultured Paludibaculum sp.]